MGNYSKEHYAFQTNVLPFSVEHLPRLTEI